MKNQSSNYSKKVKFPSHLYTSYLLRTLFNRKKLSRNDRLELVIVCAVSFGGLACAEQLEIFYNILRGRKKTPIPYNDHLCYEIEYRKKGHPFNITRDDVASSEQYFSLRRWCPDVVTKGALIGYYKTRNSNLETLPTFSQLMKKVTTEIFGSDKSNCSLNKVLPQMFNAGLLLAEANLPEWLFSYSIGDSFAASAEPSSLKHFCKPLSGRVLHSKATKAPRIKQLNNKSIFIKQTNLLGISKQSDYKLLRRLIISCENEINHGDRSRTIASFRKALNQHGEISLPCEMLVNWLLVKLSDGKRWQHGGTTPSRYLSALYQIWLNYWQKISVSDFEEYDADETYQYLLLAVTKEDKSAGSALAGLYKFIAEHYTFEVQIPENLNDEDKVTFVRSKLISNSLYEKVREEIQSHYEQRSEYFKRSIDIILILIYRCGIRIKECFHIRMKDIAALTDYNLVIRKRNDSGKTYSADRQINLTLLLKADELALLRVFIEMRKQQTLGKADALMFTQNINTSEPFSYILVNQVVIDTMERLTGEHFVFYEFRHTAITNMVLICFSDLKTAEAWTGYNQKQIIEIKKHFCGNENLILDQIKGFAGHLSPEITLSSYVHLAEFCLCYSLGSIKLEFTIKDLANILNCEQKSLKTVLGRLGTSNQTIQVQECSEYLNSEFLRFSQQTDSQYSSSGQGGFNGMKKNQLGHWNYIEPTLDSCIKLANDCLKGAKVSDVSAGLMLHPSFCNILLASLDSVVRKYEENIKSAGPVYSSLVSKDAIKYSTPKVNDEDEFNDMLRLANALIKLKYSNLLDASITEPFLKASRSHSYVIYRDIEELIRTVKFYKTIVGRERFYVVIEPLFNSAVGPYNRRLTKLLGRGNAHISDTRVHERELFPDGRYKLHVKHVNSIKLLAKRKLGGGVNKYSTNALKVALFWTEVFSNAIKLWREHDDRIRQPDLFN